MLNLAQCAGYYSVHSGATAYVIWGIVDEEVLSVGQCVVVCSLRGPLISSRFVEKLFWFVYV